MNCGGPKICLFGRRPELPGPRNWRLPIVDFMFLVDLSPHPHVLGERLIGYAVTVVGIVEALPISKPGNHIAGQLIRSGASPAPNHGEAQSAEPRNVLDINNQQSKINNRQSNRRGKLHRSSNAGRLTFMR